MCGIRWRGPERALNDSGDLVIVDRARPPGTIFIQKALDAVFQKAPPPFANSVFMDTQLAGDHLAGQTVGAAKNDPATLRQGARRAMTPYLSFQIRPLVVGKNNRLDRTPRCIHHRLAPMQSRER
jgi:hypothetical protein